MQEQEKQVALLRERIALLEGTREGGHGMKTSLTQNTVDDFSIKVRTPTNFYPTVAHGDLLDCCLQTGTRDQPLGSGRRTVSAILAQ